MALAKLSIDIVAKLAEFERDLGKAAHASDKAAAEIRKSFDGLKDYASTFAMGLSAGIAGALAGGALVSLVTDSINAADELDRLSQSTGVSVEKLSQWGAVAKRNGLDVSDLAEQINELQIKLAETDKDTEGAGYALKQLGIDYKELKKLTSEEAFTKVAEGLAKVEDSGTKAAMAMMIGGDEYQKYIGVLNDIGAGGLEAAAITAEMATQAAHYKDTLAKVSTAGDSWVSAIVGGIIPALDETAGAIIDVIGGTNGMAAGARDLAKNGTIAEWARESVSAVTYLMDAVQGAARVIRGVGQTFDAMVENASAGIFAVKQAAARAAEGDFSGAIESFQDYSVKVQGIDADLNAKLASTWNDDMLGTKIRNRLDQIKGSMTGFEKDSKPVKVKVDFDLVGSKEAAKKKEEAEKKAKAAKEKAADAAAKENERALAEYQKLITSIRAKTEAEAAEINGTAAATEAQKMALEVMTQIRDGRLKLTDAQKGNVSAYLDELLTTERLLAAKRQQIEIDAQTIEATQGVRDTMRSRTEALQEQIKAAKLEGEEVGLSAKALLALRDARELDKAAALERRAEITAGLEDGAAMAAIYRDQAAAIRELVQRRRGLADLAQRIAADPMRGADKGVRDYMDELQQAGKAAEDFAGRSLKGVEDALVSVATGGKASWKGLVDSMLAEAARLKVVRPLMQSMLGDGSSAANILGNFAGGSRGGMDSTNSWEYDAGFKSSGTSWLSTAASWASSLFGGGRATGGPVGAGMLYDVNERGTPELLTVGSKTMLMMGAEGGRVTPLDNLRPLSGSSGAGASAPVIHQTFHFGAADTVTRAEMYRAAADAKNAAIAEWANARSRGVRAYS